MINLNKGTCKVCGEYRILNKQGICCFCSKDYSGDAKEVKVVHVEKKGIEVKSKTGHADEIADILYDNLEDANFEGDFYESDFIKGAKLYVKRLRQDGADIPK